MAPNELYARRVIADKLQTLQIQLNYFVNYSARLVDNDNELNCERQACWFAGYTHRQSHRLTAEFDRKYKSGI